MTVIKHHWQIPRSDKRERCGECFVIFKKFQPRHKRPGKDLGYRFPNLCMRCYKKIEDPNEGLL